MNLPPVLKDLAELLPARLRIFWNDTDPTDVWVTHVEVKYEGWRDTWWGGDMPRWCQAWALEGMLREECEARGWFWSTGRSEVDQRGNLLNARHQYGACVAVAKVDYYGRADTPAEALAAALLAALRAEPVVLLVGR